PVIPRCLECHGTYFETNGPPPNRYVKTGFVVGVTCEKCHGPGKDHAQREAEKTTKSAGEILNPAGFSRARQMDLCAWCHAGVGTSLRPEFSYVPGEPLPNYLKLAEPDAAAALDVHGSQVELLERSRCFQKSEMTCLTCHDVHRAQRDLQEFSQRCLGCHKPETAMFPRQNHSAASNCVDCHMPLEETNLIVFDQSGKKARPKVRNHWIKVYEAAVQGK
ncbi:MAG TPA: multiheme c-type cytochrome, partial [Candidatus Binatia bacterium]|nr:multiheme c-type cytochrome [Candidatus Binatia bacterium]